MVSPPNETKRNDALSSKIAPARPDSYIRGLIGVQTTSGCVSKVHTAGSSTPPHISNLEEEGTAAAVWKSLAEGQLPDGVVSFQRQVTVLKSHVWLLSCPSFVEPPNTAITSGLLSTVTAVCPAKAGPATRGVAVREASGCSRQLFGFQTRRARLKVPQYHIVCWGGPHYATEYIQLSAAARVAFVDITVKYAAIICSERVGIAYHAAAHSGRRGTPMSTSLAAHLG